MNPSDYDLNTHYNIYLFSALSNKDYASSWNLSMEQCRDSQPSTYLLGDINLNDPGLVCDRVPRQFNVVWVGVARHSYTSIDQGIYTCIFLTSSSTQFFKIAPMVQNMFYIRVQNNR